jgi:hypothetical protein
MILTFGNMAPYQDLDWYMVELRSEKPNAMEGTLGRLGSALPTIFRDSAVEVFIPISKRDLNTFELSTGSYIYARSPHFAKLLRMKTVTGIVGLSTLGDSNHPSQAIKVENTWVKSQIDDAEAIFRARAEAIDIGSFVRILDGEMRDWCGHVTNIHDGFAVVRIAIKTKIMLVETPVRNLINKSDAPESLRVFYYSDLVESLRAVGMEYLLAEDLEFVEDTLYTDDGLEVAPPDKLGRQQTVTALVKRMIVTGTLDPIAISKAVMEAIATGSLKKPKNLSIVHGIIKTHLIEGHFIKLDPTIKNYRDVVERFGIKYKLTFPDLQEINTACGTPLPNDAPQKKSKDKSGE